MTRPRGRAIFTKPSASRRNASFPSSSSSRTTNTASAARRKTSRRKALDVFQPNDWQEVDGSDVQKIYDAGVAAFEKMRQGGGPAFFWVNMERLSSHTSSDDHKLYRSAEEIEGLAKGDPLTVWSERLISEGVITAEAYEKLDKEIKERVRDGVQRGGSRRRSARGRTGTASHGRAAAVRRRSPSRRANTASATP